MLIRLLTVIAILCSTHAFAEDVNPDGRSHEETDMDVVVSGRAVRGPRQPADWPAP